MERQRFVIMGAGTVGYYLAQTLSQQGHDVVLIELDPERADEVEEELDARVVRGNGAHFATLTDAGASACDLFMAVSSHDQSNLAASLFAKDLGASRVVARVGDADEVKIHRDTYEKLFRVDMLMSTQLLASTRVLNYILGHSTVAVEHLAQNKIQLRRIRLEEDSILVSTSLKEVEMPGSSRVVAYFGDDGLTVPSGDTRATAGSDVLILARSEVIDEVESFVSPRSQKPAKVVLAGCGATGLMVARALVGKVQRLTIIERDRARAESLAEKLKDCRILHGDATDESLLQTEGIGDADAFVAATGHDESNLMASLLAKELGVADVIAMVERSQTTHLWRKLGLVHIVSPRTLVHERIESYIGAGFNANIASLGRGFIHVMQREIYDESPTAGATFAEMELPRGLLVGAVLRGERVFVPEGQDGLEVGDRVILFVEESEVPLLLLFFPGPEAS